jgi:hypothetical protein
VQLSKIFALGIAFVVVSVLAVWSIKQSVGRRNAPWDSGAITATYMGTQLRETSGSDAALFLAYELTNNTDKDYRLSDGPGSVVMSRIKPDGSLSSQETIQLTYATFLPAHQRARIALEIQRPFLWPADNDPLLSNKLSAFVAERLGNVEEFVLFDQADRCEIDFPSAWQRLESASQADN